MADIGMIIGATIATFVLGALLNWAIVKRLPISDEMAVILSSLAAIVVAIVIYGFGNADGGPWNPGNGILSYVIGGSIAGALRFLVGRGRRASLKNTFD